MTKIQFKEEKPRMKNATILDKKWIILVLLKVKIYLQVMIMKLLELNFNILNLQLMKLFYY